MEQTLVNINEKKSPIQGEGTFPALKKGPYRKKKLDEIGSANPDLQFSGTMLDETDFRSTPEGIKIGVFGERAGAADGHNDLSGKSALPKRRFLPDVGQDYKKPIAKEVDAIVTDIIGQEQKFQASDFEGVTSKLELVRVLRTQIQAETIPQLILAVFRNEALLNLLIKLGLRKLL